MHFLKKRFSTTVELSNQLVKLIFHTESIPKNMFARFNDQTEKWPIFSQNWPISDRFRIRSCSNDLYNDVLTVGLIAKFIYNKGKLWRQQKAKSRRSFGLKQTILPKPTILKNVFLTQIRRSWSKQTILFRLFLYTKADDHSQNLKGEGRSYRLCKLFTLNYGWSENWVRDWLRVQLGMGCHLSRD